MRERGSRRQNGREQALILECGCRERGFSTDARTRVESRGTVIVPHSHRTRKPKED